MAHVRDVVASPRKWPREGRMKKVINVIILSNLHLVPFASFLPFTLRRF